jgi:hypothetical protein
MLGVPLQFLDYVIVRGLLQLCMEEHPEELSLLMVAVVAVPVLLLLAVVVAGQVPQIQDLGGRMQAVVEVQQMRLPQPLQDRRGKQLVLIPLTVD